jgi:hypothetical protein
LSTVVPFLDVVDPGFRVDSDEVDRAREAHWYARTPLGIAVLRYQEAVALLKDSRLHQGSAVLLTAGRARRADSRLVAARDLECRR